jgi:hypothetical protein
MPRMLFPLPLNGVLLLQTQFIYFPLSELQIHVEPDGT